MLRGSLTDVVPWEHNLFKEVVVETDISRILKLLLFVSSTATSGPITPFLTKAMEG